MGHLRSPDKQPRAPRLHFGIAGRTRRLGRRLVRVLTLLNDSALEIVAREPDTPAVDSGLRVGDIIVAAQLQSIAGVHTLHRFVGR